MNELPIKNSKEEIQTKTQEEILALQESEKKYKNLFLTAPAGYFRIDHSGLIIDVNQRGAHMMGMTIDDLKGHRFEENVTDEHLTTWREHLQQVFEKQIHSSIEIELKKTGLPLAVIVESVPILDEEPPLCCQTIITDISKRKRVMEELQQSKEQAELLNLEKSEFIAVLSHEMRTPLNSMLGAIELLLGSNPQPDQLQYIEMFERTGHTLLNLINDILDSSKIESGKM